MSKSATAFRTISEVANLLEVPKHVLRFWELKFPQIKPMKRGGGRRYYRPEDLDLLRGIRHLLHAEGYTIKGVQKILREQGVDAVKTAPPDAQVDLAQPDTASAVKADKSTRGGPRAVKKSAASTALATRGSAAQQSSPKSSAVSKRKALAANKAAPSRTSENEHLSNRAIEALQHAIKELEACRSALTAVHQPAKGAAKPTSSGMRKRQSSKAARA